MSSTILKPGDIIELLVNEPDPLSNLFKKGDKFVIEQLDGYGKSLERGVYQAATWQDLLDQGKIKLVEDEDEELSEDDETEFKLKEMEGACVHVKTREEYDFLMCIYEAAGWRWREGQKPTEWDGFKAMGNYIKIRNKFARKAVGSITLTLPEFLERQGIKIELYVGFGEIKFFKDSGEEYRFDMSSTSEDLYHTLLPYVKKIDGYYSSCLDEEVEKKEEEPKPTYKVGDKVRIREWDDMVDEFGYKGGCKESGINTTPWFNPDMKKYCGRVATISEVIVSYEGVQCYDLEGGGCWSWSAQMFEPVKKGQPFWKKMGFGEEILKYDKFKPARPEYISMDFGSLDREITRYAFQGTSPAGTIAEETPTPPKEEPKLSFISNPLNPMGIQISGCYGSPPHSKSLPQKVRDSKLNPAERTLRKQGFKNEVGEWTSAAYEVALDLYCEDKRDELVTIAEELQKEEKAEKKCS